MHIRRIHVVILVIAAVVGVIAGRAVFDSAANSSPWRLVSQDDFSSDQLNPRWLVYNDPRTEPKELVTVNSGELQITTTAQLSSGLCWCRDKPTPRYGRWDIRARMDPGQDHGPAILLWPTSENWPADGEIDISEMPPADRSRSTFSLHFGAKNQQIHEPTYGDFTAWHTFSVEWEPAEITFSIDGVVRYTTTDGSMIPHTDMFLAMQAGPEAANAADTTATLHVDWVRVYTR